MKIKDIISTTLLLSMLSWHIIFSWLFYTWYTAFAWFMALILALTALAFETRDGKRAKVYKKMWLDKAWEKMDWEIDELKKQLDEMEV